MDERAGVIIAIGAGVVMLRALQSGRLGNAWATLIGPPQVGSTGSWVSGSSAQSNPLPSGGSPTPVGGGGGFPPSQLFGLPAGLSLALGETDTTPTPTGISIAQADQLGLNLATARAGLSPSTLAHDLDYAATAGTTARLPPLGTYKFLGNDPGGWGNLYQFETPNGGIIEYAHDTNMAPFVVGQSYPGGMYVGQSGNPAGTGYGTGPHQAIITDTKGYAWLQSIAKALGL